MSFYGYIRLTNKILRIIFSSKFYSKTGTCEAKRSSTYSICILVSLVITMMYLLDL